MVTFIHVSILVGAMDPKTPVIGPAFKAGTAQDDRLYVSIPLKVYGSAGGIHVEATRP